jgi:hypothetical protein
MIVHKDYFSFIINDQEVFVYADETEYGLSTVLEFGNSYYYLGDQFPDLDTVILAWQDFYNKNLSDEELSYIKTNNASAQVV